MLSLFMQRELEYTIWRVDSFSHEFFKNHTSEIFLAIFDRFSGASMSISTPKSVFLQCFYFLATIQLIVTVCLPKFDLQRYFLRRIQWCCQMFVSVSFWIPNFGFLESKFLDSKKSKIGIQELPEKFFECHFWILRKNQLQVVKSHAKMICGYFITFDLLRCKFSNFPGNELEITHFNIVLIQVV